MIATQATVRSRAYFQAIKDENPFIEVYEHATPELVPLVEAGFLDGPVAEAAVERAIAPLVGETDGAGDSVFPRGRSGRIDTLLLGCTHYPLLAPIIERLAGPGIAVIDSASATASSLASLLEVEGLTAPSGATASHIQLTTGDLDAFRRTAAQLFGSLFPQVEPATVGAA